MSTANNKYILGGIFVVIISVSAYFIFSKKSNADNGGGEAPGQNCPYGRDSNGNCITPPDKCGNMPKPPANYCDPDQQLICDPKTQKWRCKSACETKDNPFPYDFSFCETDNVNCDTNGKYYCKSDYCKNGGVLYSNANGICSCPSGFSGDKCQYDSRKCKGGELDPKTGKCISCCDSTTSYTNGDSKLCNYYGDNCDQKCDDNYAYDPNTGVCVCPNCFLEKDSKCSQLSDCCKNGNIQNGKCVCSDGWTGVNCDIPICGQYGTWNSATKKCDCLKDSNGLNIAAGDRCQYTKDMCNGNGFPVTFNGVPSCICNPNFSGAHCKCDNTQKPNDDSCRGISAYCTDDGWNMKYLECDDIYKQSQYGTEQIWQEKCTNYLTGQTYPDYETVCRRKNEPDNNGLNDFFPTQETCSAMPTKEKLAECMEDNQCFVPWYNNDKNVSKTFNKVCTCHRSGDEVSYKCDPISTNNKCGDKKNVPAGFCKNADGTSDDPECQDCRNGTYVFGCKGSVLPKDCIVNNFALHSNPIKYSDKVWYNTTQDNVLNTVFPTINMDICGTSPFNSLHIDTLFGDQYQAVNSAPGFVTGLEKGNPIFYNKDDKDNIIWYNINATINEKSGIIVPDKNNMRPYPDTYSEYMDNENTGCAKLRQDFDPNQGDDNTRCALGIDGNPAGDFNQYCSDKDYNITNCSTAYFRTNKGHCNCHPYISKAQPHNDMVTYKGKYCQYNDNVTCNGGGIVDDNGKCKCNPGYAGSNCQYSDSETCNGKGTAQDDGSCICSNYISKYDNLNKPYMGNNCEYDDTTTCKNQGKVIDNNGNCKWDPLLVFPRCTELVNPDETDYNKIQCKTTVFPSLFSTNCIQKGLSDTPPDEYGCPKIRDPIPWTDYTGVSCHYPDKDANKCNTNASMIRVCIDNDCSSEDNKFNACRSNDFTSLSGLENVSAEGIINKKVTGLAGQRQETGAFVPDNIWYGYHPNTVSDTTSYSNEWKKKWNDVCNFGFSAYDRYTGSRDINYDFFD